jgi:hypothetical protein
MGWRRSKKVQSTSKRIISESDRVEEFQNSYGSMSTAESASSSPEETETADVVVDELPASTDNRKHKNKNGQRSSNMFWSRRKRRRQHQRRMYLMKLAKASQRKDGRDFNFWTCELAVKSYVVLFLFLLIRQYWVLQAISLLVVFQILRLLFSWFLFVKEAKEIREFKGLALWWIHFGLNLSTKTIEGATLHKLVTACTLNVWNIIGQDLTQYFVLNAAKDGKTKALAFAKERLSQLEKLSHLRGSSDRVE